MNDRLLGLVKRAASTKVAFGGSFMPGWSPCRAWDRHLIEHCLSAALAAPGRFYKQAFLSFLCEELD